MEPSTVKPPAVPAKALEQSSDKKERSSFVTSFQVESFVENYPSGNMPRKLPLSSNGGEHEVKIKEQLERKPKVRFETVPDNIDLSETQKVDDSVPACTELLKENSQPEVN